MRVSLEVYLGIIQVTRRVLDGVIIRLGDTVLLRDHPHVIVVVSAMASPNAGCFERLLGAPSPGCSRSLLDSVTARWTRKH